MMLLLLHVYTHPYLSPSPSLWLSLSFLFIASLIIVPPLPPSFTIAPSVPPPPLFSSPHLSSVPFPSSHSLFPTPPLSTGNPYVESTSDSLIRTLTPTISLFVVALYSEAGVQSVPDVGNVRVSYEGTDLTILGDVESGNPYETYVSVHGVGIAQFSILH